MSDQRWMLDGGRVLLDGGARTLLIDGQPAKLGGRAFDLLVALVTHRDRVVPKPELLDLVWPGLVVEENNLQVQALTLRKLLGNGAIVTVSGRGYRLTLEATSSPRAATTAAEASAPASSALVRTDAAASATELIGRAALLAEVERSLASPTARPASPQRSACRKAVPSP